VSWKVGEMESVGELESWGVGEIESWRVARVEKLGVGEW
jgi:hypothetical protein